MSGVFERLAGLETEYAIRVQAADASSPPPSKFRIYESLVAALSRAIPTARARHFKEGVFTANGGAVWFEAERPAAGGGLIEGATPECRGPKQLVAYQVAQDRMMAQSAATAHLRGQITLIKNDRDALDHVYGAQENYEVTLASGWRLLVWRMGLVALFPLALITWLMVFGCVLATLSYFLAAALIYIPLRLILGGHEQVAMLLFGRDLAEGRDTCVHLPVWLESFLNVVTRLITGPLAVVLFLLLKLTAFSAVRQKLLPFLVSRGIVTGAGMLDACGQFHVADKGPGINCLLGFGGMIGDHPIFSMGHFFKVIYAESWFSPREFCTLFQARQRLQIALGDSNMSETAQWLRVGTTMLVLDAIDAGFLAYVPRLKSPVRALHAFCADPTLRATVPQRREDRTTALQLQRFYLAACRAFLGAQTNVPAEAWEVLDLWKRTLDDLESIANGSEAPPGLLGTVDWVTKKYLLDKAGSGLPWADRKKIDIRYHELTVEGYFELLRSAGLVSRVVEEEAIDRATRTPPPGTPATTRGHYIREFSSGDESMTVNWKTITFGSGWRRRVVRLADFGRNTSTTRRAHVHRQERNVGKEKRKRSE